MNARLRNDSGVRFTVSRALAGLRGHSEVGGRKTAPALSLTAFACGVVTGKPDAGRPGSRARWTGEVILRQSCRRLRGGSGRGCSWPLKSLFAHALLVEATCRPAPTRGVGGVAALTGVEVNLLAEQEKTLEQACARAVRLIWRQPKRRLGNRAAGKHDRETRLRTTTPRVSVWTRVTGTR